MSYTPHGSIYFYRTVNATTTEYSNPVVVDDGIKVAIKRFIASGADPSAYVYLIWDRGGADETIVSSTRDSIDISYDIEFSAPSFIGDGTKSFELVLQNNSISQSPPIGGLVEVVRVE